MSPLSQQSVGNKILRYASSGYCTLVLVALLELGLIWHFATNTDPLTQAQRSESALRKATHKRFLAILHDPPLYKEIPQVRRLLQEVGYHNGSLSDTLTIICVVGDCSECGLRVMRQWVAAFERGRQECRARLIMVVQGSLPDRIAEESKQRTMGRVAIVSDQGGYITKVLNPVFLPRAYGFMHAKLVWKQTQQGLIAEDLIAQFCRTCNQYKMTGNAAERRTDTSTRATVMERR